MKYIRKTQRVLFRTARIARVPEIAAEVYER